MSRITIELIRKRSEHNEGEISTLEEIALHQENIEKIEFLDKACKDLKILLLQNNLISKIENLGRLKRLEYLNLALNNIEVIENLEPLESLRKLDLTVNFVGDLRGIECLRCNEHLEQLILTGNPCADYEGYREYAVATLSQLKELDAKPIERSERIMALQIYARVEGDVIRGYWDYKKKREAQIIRYREKTEAEEDREENEDEENERFWKRTSHHTPEDRIEIAKRCIEKEERKNSKRNAQNELNRREPKLFSPQGRPYNMNHAKVPFKLNSEDDPRHIILDIAIYKYLDTSYVDVDIQPDYIRVTIKGKILQLTLPCEISVERSIAKRNVTSGNLVITMPRSSPVAVIAKFNGSSTNEKPVESNREVVRAPGLTTTRREYLEIGPPKDDLDFSRIVSRGRDPSLKKESSEAGDTNDEENPEVPPLE